MHDYTDAISCIDAPNQESRELNLRRDVTSWLLSFRCTIATPQKRYNLFIKLFALIYVTRLNGHLFHSSFFPAAPFSGVRLIFLHLLFFCNFSCTPDRNQLVNYCCGTKCAVLASRRRRLNRFAAASKATTAAAAYPTHSANVNVELIYLQFYIII